MTNYWTRRKTLFLLSAFVLSVIVAQHLTFAATLEPGTDCNSGVAAPLAEYGVAVSELPIGSFAADSLSSHFLNPDGSIFANSYWTTAPTKYQKANDYTKWSLQSKYCSRDMEVDTWSRNGMVFLRKTADGRALYFMHNGETTNGTLEIGIVTNFNEGVGYRYVSASGGTFRPLYSNLNIKGTVPGYVKTATENQVFTFGAEGFDIYVKMNGVEFLRFKEYRHMDAGRAAIQANNGYGFRNIIVRNFSSKPLFSDYSHNILDLRDFGLREITTTGSITSGSNQLTLPNAPSPSFAVGDYVIVETGGEPGGGMRGTIGVGGAWPAKRYADAGSRSADTSQPANTYAWIESNGTVSQWNGSSWVPVTNNYYVEKAIPKALQAKIIAISSDHRTLTLDSTASATVANAAIYLDNAYVINKLARRPAYDGEMNWPAETIPNDFSALTPTGVTLSVPAGNYAIGRKVLVHTHDSWTLAGGGKDATLFFSPKGTMSGSLRAYSSQNITFKDFHWKGNARDNGFGLDVTETNIPQGSAYPYGVIFMQGSHNGKARDLTVTDVFQFAGGASFSNDVSVERVHNIMTDGLKRYIQWMFLWADSAGGKCIDCKVTSPYLIAGFEGFKSTRIQFIRPVGINASMSMNSSGNFTIEDGLLTIKANSQDPQKSFSEHNPLININSNIGTSSALALGGIIKNTVMTQEGYINANNDVLKGIVINANNPNIRVEGGSYESPDWKSPSVLSGATGLHSAGASTTVDGMRVIGKVNTSIHPQANIRVSKGVVRNCIADVVRVDEGPIENCKTNAEYEAGRTYGLSHFVTLAADWLQTKISPADLNRDGTVNVQDLEIMLAGYKP